jgi:hypothetical protein
MIIKNTKLNKAWKTNSVNMYVFSKRMENLVEIEKKNHKKTIEDES